MPPDLQNIIGLIHLPTLLRCEPKLVQYFLTQNKAFQSTVSENLVMFSTLKIETTSSDRFRSKFYYYQIQGKTYL